AGGGRPVPLHPFVPQGQFLRRSGEQEEPGVGQGGQGEFGGRGRTAARRLQAGPPEPGARRRGLLWEEPEPGEGPARGGRLGAPLAAPPGPASGARASSLPLHQWTGPGTIKRAGGSPPRAPGKNLKSTSGARGGFWQESGQRR